MSYYIFLLFGVVVAMGFAITAVIMLIFLFQRVNNLNAGIARLITRRPDGPTP